MWLLLALLGLLIGYDLRSRAREMSLDDSRAATANMIGYANAAGAWISFGGGICLNLAVWSVF